MDHWNKFKDFDTNGDRTLDLGEVRKMFVKTVTALWNNHMPVINVFYIPPSTLLCTCRLGGMSVFPELVEPIMYLRTLNPRDFKLVHWLISTRRWSLLLRRSRSRPFSTLLLRGHKCFTNISCCHFCFFCKLWQICEIKIPLDVNTAKRISRTILKKILDLDPPHQGIVMSVNFEFPLSFALLILKNSSFYLFMIKLCEISFNEIALVHMPQLWTCKSVAVSSVHGQSTGLL